jgi:hypothetical protein
VGVLQLIEPFERRRAGQPTEIERCRPVGLLSNKARLREKIEKPDAPALVSHGLMLHFGNRHEIHPGRFRRACRIRIPAENATVT